MTDCMTLIELHNCFSGDDGFGDVPSMDAPRTPEMLRDASAMDQDFGADALSLAPEVSTHICIMYMIGT